MNRIAITGTEPVSLEEAKRWCRVDHDDEDDDFLLMIKAARNAAEGLTQRAIIQATYEQVYDQFPVAEMELGKAPVQSVASIIYIDSNGDSQTLSSGEYTIDALSSQQKGWVLPVDAWPDTYDTFNAVKVRFVAGYTDGSVPELIRMWMRLFIVAMYSGEQLPASANGLLDEFCVY